MQLEAIAERVVEMLCADRVPLRRLPEALVQDWPDAHILDLVLAIATGCDAVERMFGTDGPSGKRAREGWQIAALIATDLRAMQAMGITGDRARDLHDYWASQDPFFLTQNAAE